MKLYSWLTVHRAVSDMLIVRCWGFAQRQRDLRLSSSNVPYLSKTCGNLHCSLYIEKLVFNSLCILHYIQKRDLNVCLQKTTSHYLNLSKGSTLNMWWKSILRNSSGSAEQMRYEEIYMYLYCQIQIIINSIVDFEDSGTDNCSPMTMIRIPSHSATVLPFSSEVNPEAASTFSRILLSFITLVAQTYPCLQDRGGKQLVKQLVKQPQGPQQALVFASDFIQVKLQMTLLHESTCLLEK